MWCAPRPGPKSLTGGPGERGADCYLIVRPLPLPLPLAAPAEVILLVFMSSPIYLRMVRARVDGGAAGNVRLKEFVAAFELLVFRLDDLDAVDDFQQACLKGFGLPGEGSQSQARGACMGISNAKMQNGLGRPRRRHGCACHRVLCGVEGAKGNAAARKRTHSIKAWRASWPIFSISSLLRRGLMVLASLSSYSSSLSSTWGLSRGIMMVPLDFLLPRRGRCSFVWSWSLTDELDEVELMSSGYEARRSTLSTGSGKGSIVESVMAEGGSGAAQKA
jgi:hypothetical protein